VKAVYSAIETGKPLPSHLSTIEQLIAPGIEGIVKKHGSTMDAINANALAAVEALKTQSSTLASRVESGHVLITGGTYLLATGEVMLLE